MARDFKPRGVGDRVQLFALMPVWEAQRLLSRMAAGPTKMDDCECAHVFVDVRQPEGGGRRAGARRAPGRGQRWSGAPLPMVLQPAPWPPSRGRRTTPASSSRSGLLADGRRPSVGDFTFLCPRRVGGRMVSTMKGWYDIKLRVNVGGNPEDEKHVIILNRALQWGPGSLWKPTRPTRSVLSSRWVFRRTPRAWSRQRCESRSRRLWRITQSAHQLRPPECGGHRHLPRQRSGGLGLRSILL